MVDTYFELKKQFNKVAGMIEDNADDIEIELELIQLETVASNMIAYLSRKRGQKMREQAVVK